jgi:hypothetical protein
MKNEFKIPIITIDNMNEYSSYLSLENCIKHYKFSIMTVYNREVNFNIFGISIEKYDRI